jgi:hypothetical protein
MVRDRGLGRERRHGWPPAEPRRSARGGRRLGPAPDRRGDILPPVLASSSSGVGMLPRRWPAPIHSAWRGRRAASPGGLWRASRPARRPLAPSPRQAAGPGPHPPPIPDGHREALGGVQACSSRGLLHGGTSILAAIAVIRTRAHGQVPREGLAGGCGGRGSTGWSTRFPGAVRRALAVHGRELGIPICLRGGRVLRCRGPGSCRDAIASDLGLTGVRYVVGRYSRGGGAGHGVGSL